MNHDTSIRATRQRLRRLSWFLLALAACAPAPKPGADTDLDLGGGISMSPAGEIRGATAAWTSGPPSFDGELAQPLVMPGLQVGQVR